MITAWFSEHAAMALLAQIAGDITVLTNIRKIDTVKKNVTSDGSELPDKLII